MESKSRVPFAKELKLHQIRWATEVGIAHYLEDKPDWVLRLERKDHNLYKSEWLAFIKGHEHRWFRALNSSQAFAVNLFGPLVKDPERARHVFTQLNPNRPLHGDDDVHVILEHTPDEGPAWLGEKRRDSQLRQTSS